MKIRSPFNDYYDSAMAHGSDQSRVFVRTPESRRLRLERDGGGLWDRYSRLSGISSTFDLKRDRVLLGACAILFCGRVYKALRVVRLREGAVAARTEKAEQSPQQQNNAEERVFYDAAESQQYLQVLLGEERMKRKRDPFLEYGNPLAEGTLSEGLKRFFERQGSDELMQWSVENRIAIAVLHVGGQFEKSLLEINPPLKGIQFYRLFGAAAAFQELDMFWGGMFAPETQPMVVISDKDRVSQHGFNQRSFRKDPTKKR